MQPVESTAFASDPIVWLVSHLGDERVERVPYRRAIAALLGATMEFVQYLSGVGPMQQVGLAGFLVYIASFGAVQFGWLDGNGASYAGANVLAASLVAVSLVEHFNLASALIQGSWIVIGGFGLLIRMPTTSGPIASGPIASGRAAASPDAGPMVRASRRLAMFMRAWRGRRQVARLAQFSDDMLADIGVTYGDVRAALAGPRHEDPTRRLAHLAAQRRAMRAGRNA